MECRYCGAVYQESKCPYCGAPSEEPPEEDNIKIKFGQKTYEFDIPQVFISPNLQSKVKSLGKRKGLAILLCLLGFFGLSGLHRLYVGKYVTGILYFLTCGWFFIGTICDLYSISKGSFVAADGTPLR